MNSNLITVKPVAPIAPMEDTKVRINIDTLKALGLKNLEDFDINGGNDLYLAHSFADFANY